MKKFFAIHVLIISLLMSNCNSKKHYDTYRMGNLEVMQSDLGTMDWNTAIKTCSELGGGWRLPTFSEFDTICKNKDNIKNLSANHAYWCLDEKDLSSAWAQNLFVCSVYPINKNDKAKVRAIRRFQ